MANWKIDKNWWIYDKENNWKPLIPLKKVGIGFAKTSKFAFNCNKSDRIELQQKWLDWNAIFKMHLFSEYHFGSFPLNYLKNLINVKSVQ